MTRSKGPIFSACGTGPSPTNCHSGRHQRTASPWNRRVLGRQTRRAGRADWVGSAGHGTVLAIDSHILTTFEFQDTLRVGVDQLLGHLRNRGLPVTLLSGNTALNVKGFSEAIGLPDWRASVLLSEKAQFFKT
jgi:cation transport ATPase